MQDDPGKELLEEETHLDSFRDIRKGAVAFGTYQKRLFLMMGFYWITASFFLILPFYFFKLPLYCQEPQNSDSSFCTPCTNDCISRLCASGQDIRTFVKEEHTLTYSFGLFCDSEGWRMFYKLGSQSMPWIGLLLFGYIGDFKGRKLAFKISWRFYTIGLVFLTFTNTQFLISFGYFIACISCFASLMIQFVLLFEQIAPEIRVFACYLLLGFLLIGPLLCSFLSSYLMAIGRTWTLTILCTVPSVVLSMVTGYLEESALFVYKNSKLHAFNILNKIAKINGSPPFIIDLSQSCWRKLNFYQPSITDIAQHPPTRHKILCGLFFSFYFYYNRYLAQIQLDPFTDQYLRGTLMNASSALATLTVIVLFSRFKLHNLRIPTTIAPFLLLINLLAILFEFDQDDITYALSIAIRYISDVGFSILLIWAIEAYPTVCRTRCVGLVLCGCSFGTCLAYALLSTPVVQLSVGLSLSGIGLMLSKEIRLDHAHRLMDTLSNRGYDRQDQFKRVV